MILYKLLPQIQLFFKRVISIITNPAATNIGFKIFTHCIDSSIDKLIPEEILSLRPATFRISSRSPVQIADPFLAEKNGVQYCFFEIKNVKAPGRIAYIELGSKRSRQIHYCNFDTDLHKSFPFVFKESTSENIYMIPETVAEGEVAIYEPVKFPDTWKKKKTLLIGDFVDSHIFYHKDIYYLFTTRKIKKNNSDIYDYELWLYYSENLLGSYKSHSMSPICTGRKYSRSGGAITMMNGEIFRIVQDCEQSYGREINIFRVLTISPLEYLEEKFMNNWIENTLKHRYGGHHLSFFSNSHKSYMAVDFNYKDFYLQRLLDPLIK
jgi:hypothetical protein